MEYFKKCDKNNSAYITDHNTSSEDNSRLDGQKMES
jgi:hypothetical protein